MFLKQPLTEYKQDSYKLFADLVTRIKLEAVKTLQLVQFDFTSHEEEEAAIEHMKEGLETSIEQQIHSNESSSSEDSSKLTPQKASKKPKRNDLCPCQSGQKYKNCCGKSGPKKGLLA